MENLHNQLIASFSSRSEGRLTFLLVLAAVVIGAELMWSAIRNTSYDIDNYSASIYSGTVSREAREAAILKNELRGVNIEQPDEEWQAIDRAIEGL